MGYKLEVLPWTREIDEVLGRRLGLSSTHVNLGIIFHKEYWIRREEEIKSISTMFPDSRFTIMVYDNDKISVEYYKAGKIQKENCEIFVPSFDEEKLL